RPQCPRESRPLSQGGQRISRNSLQPTPRPAAPREVEEQHVRTDPTRVSFPGEPAPSMPTAGSAAGKLVTLKGGKPTRLGRPAPGSSRQDQDEQPGAIGAWQEGLESPQDSMGGEAGVRGVVYDPVRVGAGGAADFGQGRRGGSLKKWHPWHPVTTP